MKLKGSGGAVGFGGTTGAVTTGAGGGGGGATYQECAANSEPDAVASATRCATCSSERVIGTWVAAAAGRTACAEVVEPRAGSTESGSLGPNATQAPISAALPISHLPRRVRFTAVPPRARRRQSRYRHS